MTPHIVIRKLVTIFPLLTLHPHDYCVTANLYLVSSLSALSQLPTHLATVKMSVYVHLFQFCSFILSFRLKWLIDMYLLSFLFIFFIFFFLLKEDSDPNPSHLVDIFSPHQNTTQHLPLVTHSRGRLSNTRASVGGLLHS